MARNSPAEKSFTYFALLEAFGKPGCAICRLLQEHSSAYLDAIFYEQVTDVGTRRRLRHARGFCNWHVWEARKIPTAASGMAIIAKDLLEEEIARLAELQRQVFPALSAHAFQGGPRRKSLLAFLREWCQKGMCPACQVLIEHERHALETTLNFLLDEEFARCFEDSDGLCLPHTVRTIEVDCRHPGLRRLVELQHARFTQLVADLDEFSHLCDNLPASELWDRESRSWLRAIETLAGKVGVFGNDLQRPYPPRSRWTKLLNRGLRVMFRTVW